MYTNISFLYGLRKKKEYEVIFLALYNARKTTFCTWVWCLLSKWWVRKNIFPISYILKKVLRCRKKCVLFSISGYIPSVPEPEAQRYCPRGEDDLFPLRRYLSRISPTVLLLSICSNSRDTGLLEIFHPLSVYSSSILLSHIRGSFFPKNKQIKDRLWECLTGNQCQSERQ